MKAMLMAAGKGTRFGQISETIPKVLLDINGKSLLRHAVENCASYGFDDLIINVHHLAGMVGEEIAKLRKEGFRITISDESDVLLETGGGLYKARDFFSNEPFLLYNADTITDLDLTALYNYHLKNKGLATLAVRHRPGKRYLLVDQQGRLRGWCNKVTGEIITAVEEPGSLTEIAFSGRHIINPEIFRYMTDGIYTMTALYLHLAESHDIYTFPEDGGYWFNVGTPEDLKSAIDYFQR
ncbi:MAG: nucleotidyltransferase family protein [Bacteroidales bacterium]|jgi:NDP-sugar pyrophosphorylase family protein|nr:nucleotidyltransferase family protein [Bacteroidales bacterium]